MKSGMHLGNRPKDIFSKDRWSYFAFKCEKLIKIQEIILTPRRPFKSALQPFDPSSFITYPLLFGLNGSELEAGVGTFMYGCDFQAYDWESSHEEEQFCLSQHLGRVSYCVPQVFCSAYIEGKGMPCTVFKAFSSVKGRDKR